MKGLMTGTSSKGRSIMRRPNRLIAAAVLMAFSGVLGGCSSGFGSGFDPTDMLDFLDTKKKLPGDRKPVFPDGVPGLDQGVPKDMYKGAQQQQPMDQPQNGDMAAQTAAAAPPPPEEPKSKQAKKGKGKQPAMAAAPAGQPAAMPDGEATPEEDATPAAPPPPPKSKKVASRKRITTPDQPADQGGQSAQQQSAPFPAPMPSGTFTR
jgi:hypothetical protein